MPLRRRFLLTGILVFALSLGFLARGPSLLEAAPSASNSELVSAQVQLPTLEQVFNPETIGPGSISTLQFTINNTSDQSLSDMTFTNALPAGLVIAVPASATSTCGVSSVVDAPEGGTTITFSDGKLGIGQECTVSVNVTGNAAGTYTSVSSNLNTSVGTSGTSTDDLTVATDRPGFTKSFSPGTIQKGERSRLVFTIDNTANAADAYNLAFTDNLPVGLVVASPPNVQSTCIGGTLTAKADSQSIVLTPPFLGITAVSAGGTCTIAVDILASGIGSGPLGEIKNITGDLTSTDQFNSTIKSSGLAGAIVYVRFDSLRLEKSFVDDPIPPGGTGTLQFTIRNYDRRQDATDIAFTDDLDAALSGLTAIGLPASNVCGDGSQLTGTGELTLTGGELQAEESCTFSVEVQVPIGATPGAYVNTTSAISGNYDGMLTTGEAASDTLFVEPTPLLTKTFADDPVGAGGTVTLEFSITNTSSGLAATDITFTDEFPAIISSATLPANGFCGIGSSALFSPASNSDPANLLISGASLESSASCTFQIVLDVVEGAPGGVYRNTTSTISALIDDSTVNGPGASDDLSVAGAPRLRKEFTDDPILPGGTVTLEFTLTHDDNAPGDATAINFTDDLSAVLPGLTATGLPQSNVCGAGSLSGTSNLNFTGGTLAPGESCTFSVSLAVPTNATPGSHTNTTSSVNATVLGLATTGNPASDDLKIAALTLTKSFTNDPALPGGTVTLEFTINNLSTSDDATSIAFQDDLDDTLDGLAAATTLPLEDICGMGSSLAGLAGNSLLTFQGGSLLAGTSCTFSVELNVPSNALSGNHKNRTSGFSATIDTQTIQFENASDTLVVDGELLSLSKTFTNDPVAPGGTVQLEFTVTNLSDDYDVTDIAFSDHLDIALSGLQSTSGTISNVCGTGSTIAGTTTLNLSDGNLLAGQTCTFSVNVQVPANVSAGTIAVNTTSDLTGQVDGLVATGAGASDTLQIGTAITADAGGPYSVSEGGSVQLSGSSAGTVGTITYLWDLDNNGTFETAGQNPTFSASGLDGPGQALVKVLVKSDGVGTATDQAVIAVNNVAPSVTAGNDQTINEGDSITLVASFTDPAGVNDTHTVSVDWGDGSANGSSLTDSHTYADDGSYTVTVTVTDDDNGVGSDSLTVTVNNVAPTVTAGNDQTINEGDSITLAASFTDPAGVNDTHTVSVDWGDGSTNGSSLNDNHTYADDGSYTVTVTVTDDDNGVGTDSLTVTVNNVAPTVDAGPDRRVFEDEVLSINATFSDPGVLDTHTAIIDWGDGSPVTNGTVNQTARTVSGSHVYPEIGSYTVQITVTDDDQESGSDTFELSVDNGFLQNCLFSNDKDMKIGKESQVACNAGSIGKSEIGEQSQVAGNVAAGDEIKLKKESHVSGDATSAEEVKLEKDATVGGTISQNTGVSPWAATTLFPAFSVSATGADVKVEKNQSLSLTPGNYGKLDAKQNTTVILAPGEYIFEKLDIDKDSLLIISGPTVIWVEEDVKLNEGVHIQAVATHLLILGGKNIDLAKNGVYRGSFLAPTGNVKLKQDSQLIGLLYGESVDTDQGSTVNPGPALELIAQTVSNLPTSSSGASGVEQVEESSFQIFVPTINR